VRSEPPPDASTARPRGLSHTRRRCAAGGCGQRPATALQCGRRVPTAGAARRCAQRLATALQWPSGRGQRLATASPRLLSPWSAERLPDLWNARCDVRCWRDSRGRCLPEGHIFSADRHSELVDGPRSDSVLTQRRSDPVARPGVFSDQACGRGSAGRASPCQGEGRGFESRRPLGDVASGEPCLAV
jgi:hypothetical protein